MSILHVKQIVGKLQPLFENKIDITDVRDKGVERESKVISRCLAAYADITIQPAPWMRPQTR
jgi:hypothetical protein